MRQVKDRLHLCIFFGNSKPYDMAHQHTCSTMGKMLISYCADTSLFLFYVLILHLFDSPSHECLPCICSLVAGIFCSAL